MRRSRNHLVMAILGCAVLALAAPGPSLRADDDRAAIEQTARDYIEGWYTSDAARMARALHPDLVKRRIETLSDGRQVVKTVGRDQMIEWTRIGGGSRTPPEQRNISVQVLDISGDIAAVKTISSDYVDLLSMAKIEGKWVIVNVLWGYAAK